MRKPLLIQFPRDLRHIMQRQRIDSRHDRLVRKNGPYIFRNCLVRCGGIGVDRDPEERGQADRQDSGMVHEPDKAVRHRQNLVSQRSLTLQQFMNKK
jgi:hypothetical protein